MFVFCLYIIISVELLQQGSFRPDMLFIIGLLVVLTVINVGVKLNVGLQVQILHYAHISLLVFDVRQINK